SPWVHIKVEPGQTARVRLGGMGRPVVGRAVKPAGSKVSIDWTNSSNHFQLKPPPINEPKNMNKEQRAAWYKAWITTEEGKAHLAYLRDPRFYAFRVEPDGSFRIDDVIPGPYELTFWLGDGRNPHQAVATASRPVVVLGIPGGRSDQPLDLGTIELSAAP